MIKTYQMWGQKTILWRSFDNPIQSLIQYDKTELNEFDDLERHPFAKKNHF